MEETAIQLTDKIADFYIKSPTKNTLHFHHVLTTTDVLEVTIYNNIEIGPKATSAAFNYIFIKDSEKHPILFDAIRVHLLPTTHDTRFFPTLTMKLLNDCLQELRKTTSTNQSINLIRATIGIDYQVPEKFEAIMFDLPKFCITMIHPGVVRCMTTVKNVNIMRMSCIYRIRNKPIENDVPNFGRPQQARNYEIKKIHNIQKIWPYQIHIEPISIEPLQNPNIVCFALSENANHLSEWNNYLNLLFAFTWNDCGRRNPKQLQSKHIPSYHGRTCYGHHLESNLVLFQKIEPIVTNVCSQGFVTTCDFAIQYIPCAA
jgi:hypothetical protein